MKMGVTGKLFCVFILLLHKSVQQQVFNDKGKLTLPKNYKIGWMETLNDEKLISDITIPGTHDTMALHKAIMGAKCQAWSLENQLKAGIRYLDLRVNGEDMRIVHGITDQKATFAEVFNKLKSFLSEYKTETVLVRVKEETGGKIPDNVIHQLKNDPGCWVSNNTPQIGKVRGKIVFVQKNCFQLGIRLLETDKKGDHKVYDIDKKKEKITQHLKEAFNACEAHIAVLSYSSGTGLPIKTPNRIASKINPWLYDHLKGMSEPNQKHCFGILAMDFPGFDLIQRIIGFN